MTTYDAVMAGIILLGMVFGFLRGATWQVAGITSIVLGYVLAHPLSAMLAPHFPGEALVARGASMAAIYAAVSSGVFLAAWGVRATLRKMQFEAYDRHLGMILGGIEGAMLGTVVTLFVTSLVPATRSEIFGSITGHGVCRVLTAMGPVLPDEFRTALCPYLEKSGAMAEVAAIRDNATFGADPADGGAADAGATADGPPASDLSTDETPVVAASRAPAGSQAVARAPVVTTHPAPAPATTAAEAARGEDGSLDGLIERGEERIGRAIADGAVNRVRKPSAGNGAASGGGGSDDGTLERR